MAESTEKSQGRPVPTHIKNLEEVSEYLRDSYIPVSPKDASLGYRLNIDEDVPEDQVRVKLGEFRNNNRELFSRNKVISAELEAKERELSDLRKKIEERNTTANTQSGTQNHSESSDIDSDSFWQNEKVQKKIEERIRPFRLDKDREVLEVRSALDKVAAEKAELEKRLDSHQLERQFDRAMSVNGFQPIRPEARDNIKDIVLSSLRKDAEGNVFVVDRDGQTRFSKKEVGHPLSVEEYLLEISNRYDYLFLNSSGGGSSGSSRTTTIPSAMSRTHGGVGTISLSNPGGAKAVINNLEDVARGKIKLRP